MLGRNSYTQEELDNAKDSVARQLGAYARLAKAVDATSDPKAKEALDAFEPVMFNNMTLVLDRLFVHRVRNVSGKDGNPLNEVELMTESLMNNDGVMRGNNVIKLDPQKTVAKVKFGERIALTAAPFDRLAKAFFAEVEARFR
jgi:hypothetical protein